MRNRLFTHAAALVLGTFLAGSTGLAQTPVSAIRLPSPQDQRISTDIYGDALPGEALARLGTLRWRHSGMVVFSHYLPDGKGLLTAGQDGTIRVWDVNSGKEIRHFGTLPKGPVIQPTAPARRSAYPINQLNGVAVSPDGKTLVSATQNVFLTFWDVATGALLRQFRATANNGILSLTFAPDGKSVAYMSYNEQIRLVSVADGRELRKFAGPAAQFRSGINRRLFLGNAMQSCNLAFSSDGKLLLAAAMEYGQNMFNAIVRRWEAETGTELKAIAGPKQMSFEGVAFSPDGVSVAWACNDNSARITDLVTGKELRRVPGPAMTYTNAVAFTRDGKTLITRHGDQTLRLWDAASGKEIRSLRSGFAVSNIAFSPDGKRLAIGTNGNTVRQWDLATGKETGAGVGHHGAVTNLALSSDGKTVASRSSDNVIHLWHVAAGKEISRFGLDGRVGPVAFSHDLGMAAAGSYDGILRLYDMRTGKETRQWKAHLNGFVSLTISPDGKLIASRAYDQVTHLWDATTGREVRQIVPPGVSTAVNGVFFRGVNSMAPLLAFSPDGSMLAGMFGNSAYYNLRRSSMPAGPRNSTLLLWDVHTGKLLRRFEPAKIGIAHATFAPDGRTIATANINGTISLWESDSGKERFQFKTGGTGAINVLTFTPNGKMLVGGDPQGHAIRFWDVLTGKELAAFAGHQGAIASLVLANNGKTLVSGSSDTTALVWNVSRPEKALQPLPPVELDSARVESLWNDLAGADAKKAFDAVRTLAAAPREALPLLSQRARPVAPPDPQHLARLIADLNSNKFATRQKASEDLEKLGELAADALQKVIAGQPSLEMRKRAEQLLERLVTGQSLPQEELRKLRALEVLELQGTAEARDLLAQLATGAAGSRITREAQAALRRLSKPQE